MSSYNKTSPPSDLKRVVFVRNTDHKAVVKHLEEYGSIYKFSRSYKWNVSEAIHGWVIITCPAEIDGHHFYNLVSWLANEESFSGVVGLSVSSDNDPFWNFAFQTDPKNDGSSVIGLASDGSWFTYDMVLMELFKCAKPAFEVSSNDPINGFLAGHQVPSQLAEYRSLAFHRGAFVEKRKMDVKNLTQPLLFIAGKRILKEITDLDTTVRKSYIILFYVMIPITIFVAVLSWKQQPLRLAIETAICLLSPCLLTMLHLSAIMVYGSTCKIFLLEDKRLVVKKIIFLMPIYKIIEMNGIARIDLVVGFEVTAIARIVLRDARGKKIAGFPAYNLKDRTDLIRLVKEANPLLEVLVTEKYDW